MYKLVVFSALLSIAAASTLKAWSAPVIQTYAAPAVAIGHAITKQVHYASQPVVTGYSSEILKPNLGALATPLETVTKQRVLAPARTVATITPQITQVHPELHVRKLPIDVPVAQPFVSEVEVRHPAPIVAPFATPLAAPLAAPLATPLATAVKVESRIATPNLISYAGHPTWASLY